MIAVNGMFGPPDHCLSDKVGGFKIHVGDPHRQNVGIAKHLLAQIILNAVSISAIDNLVEIVFHHLSFLCRKVAKKFFGFCGRYGKKMYFCRVKRQRSLISGESHSGNCNRL